ncbi:MAG: hypothetical protein LCH31_10710 [Actinobacteria bacterium]|nr:hypothetical protein [Actinomycetota bacterium]
MAGPARLPRDPRAALALRCAGNPNQPGSQSIRPRPLEQASPACDVPCEASREAHWVRPALAAEVVSKGRTASGALRQPVWRGWRPDKNPSSQGGERR